MTPIVESHSPSSIARSLQILGVHLYEVLVDEKGNTLDGNTRLLADPRWPKRVIRIGGNKKKALLIKVHANINRREIPPSEKVGWILEARKIIQSEGKKGTQEEIAKLLGFTQMWVSKYDPEPIRPLKPHERIARRITPSEDDSTLANNKNELGTPTRSFTEGIVANENNPTAFVGTHRQRVEDAIRILMMQGCPRAHSGATLQWSCGCQLSVTL